MLLQLHVNTLGLKVKGLAADETEPLRGSGKKGKAADDGARTRDHEVKSLALYRLSYIGYVLYFKTLNPKP